jgi:hypothetical protein
LLAGIIAAIAVAVIVLLLSVPLDLSIRLEIREKPALRFGFAWLFGLIRKESGGDRKQGERKRRVPSKERAKKKPRQRWAFVDLLRIRGLVPGVLRLLRDVLRRVRIKHLSVDFLAGLGDPADTALVVGSVWLPVLLLSQSSSHAVRLQPSFDGGPVLQGHAHLVLRVRPIRLMPPIVRFVCSRPALRLLRLMVSSRWKRKR